MHRQLWGATRRNGHPGRLCFSRRLSALNHHLLMHDLRGTCSRSIASHCATKTAPALPRIRLFGPALPQQQHSFGFHTTCHRSSWLPRFKKENTSSDPDNEPSEYHEEAAKAAILEKAMKGRQPTDLLLRCKYICFFLLSIIPAFTHVSLTRSENRHRIGRRRLVRLCNARNRILNCVVS